MKKNALITTFLLFFTAFAWFCNAQDAVQWRYDRTGIYKEAGLLKSWPEAGPQLAWSYDGLGEGHSSVAVSTSGKLYIT
ncbi:MAG: hypothetical protein LBC98_04535, partial [Prevotellaceae bacterium]|nr:hypothetical protein [Prevotellaceae bacterium]